MGSISYVRSKDLQKLSTTDDAYTTRISHSHDVLYVSDHVGLIGSTVDVTCYGSANKWYINAHATMVEGEDEISDDQLGRQVWSYIQGK